MDGLFLGCCCYCILISFSVQNVSGREKPGSRKRTTSSSRRKGLPIGAVFRDDWTRKSSKISRGDIFQLSDPYDFKDGDSYFGFDQHFGPYYAFKKTFYGKPPPILLQKMGMPYKKPCLKGCDFKQGLIKYSMKKVVYPKTLALKPVKKIIYPKPIPEVVYASPGKWPSSYGADWAGDGNKPGVWPGSTFSSYGMPIVSYPVSGYDTSYDDGAYTHDTTYDVSDYSHGPPPPTTYEILDSGKGSDNVHQHAASGEDLLASVYAQQPTSYTKDPSMPDLSYNHKTVVLQSEKTKESDFGAHSYTGSEIISKPSDNSESYDQVLYKDPYGPTYLPQHHQGEFAAQEQTQEHAVKEKPISVRKKIKKKKCRRKE